MFGPRLRVLILVLALLFYQQAGAHAASPAAETVAMLGCRACHRIAGQGGSLATDLTAIGQRQTAGELRSRLQSHQGSQAAAPMPAFDYLSDTELQLLLDFLQQQ